MRADTPLRYMPGLDGIRALAAIGIVCCHAQVNQPRGMSSLDHWASGFYIAVDVFFVLSGYLITRLLAETTPTLRQFYIRRFRRLMPPLMLMIAVYLVVGYWLKPDYPHYIEAGLAAIYLADFGAAYWGMPHYLLHTWSLSVEEHFYLLWPLIFFRWRPTMKVLLWAFLFATLWRLPMEWGLFYHRFDARVSGLILGCIIAHLPRDKFPAWPGLLALLYLGFYMRPGTPFAQGPGLTAVELASAVAILGKHPKWLESEAMTYLGKLSYGIYLWHTPVADLMESWTWQAKLPVMLAASVALSALSYHTLEAWVRRSGHKRLDGRADGAGIGVVDH